MHGYAWVSTAWQHACARRLQTQPACVAHGAPHHLPNAKSPHALARYHMSVLASWRKSTGGATSSPFCNLPQPCKTPYNSKQWCSAIRRISERFVAKTLTCFSYDHDHGDVTHVFLLRPQARDMLTGEGRLVPSTFFFFWMGQTQAKHGWY